MPGQVLAGSHHTALHSQRAHTFTGGGDFNALALEPSPTPRALTLSPARLLRRTSPTTPPKATPTNASFTTSWPHRTTAYRRAGCKKHRRTDTPTKDPTETRCNWITLLYTRTGGNVIHDVHTLPIPGLHRPLGSLYSNVLQHVSHRDMIWRPSFTRTSESKPAKTKPNG